MNNRIYFFLIPMFFTLVMVLMPASAHAIDLKSVQPVQKMQPIAPVKPGVPVKVQPVQAVDLMVVPGSLRWRTPPMTGQPSADGSFQFTVRNIGGVPTNPNVLIACTGISGSPPCPGQMTGSKTLGEMDGAGGMNAEKTDYWPPPLAGSEAWQAGTYEIQVQALAGKGQMEPNTTNNVQTLRFGVIGAAVFPQSSTESNSITPQVVSGETPQMKPPSGTGLRPPPPRRSAPASVPKGNDRQLTTTASPELPPAGSRIPSNTTEQSVVDVQPELPKDSNNAVELFAPDLVLDLKYIGPSEGPMERTEVAPIYRIKVKNVGNAPAAPNYLRVLCKMERHQCPDAPFVWWYLVDMLEAGQIFEVLWPLRNGRFWSRGGYMVNQGEHQIEIIVDFENNVKEISHMRGNGTFWESGENNNDIRNRHFKVIPFRRSSPN